MIPLLQSDANRNVALQSNELYLLLLLNQTRINEWLVYSKKQLYLFHVVTFFSLLKTLGSIFNEFESLLERNSG